MVSEIDALMGHIFETLSTNKPLEITVYTCSRGRSIDVVVLGTRMTFRGRWSKGFPADVTTQWTWQEVGQGTTLLLTLNTSGKK